MSKSESNSIVYTHPVIGEVETKALSPFDEAVKLFGEALGMAWAMGRNLVVRCDGHDPRRVGSFLADHCGCGDYSMSVQSGDDGDTVHVECTKGAFHAPAVVRTSKLRYDFGKPDPRPFKVGDLVRISRGHSLLSVRGKTIEISEIDHIGLLYGELPDYGRVGVDPKNATLVDEDGEQTVPQPKSGRTTAMVLDVVLRAVRGQDVRVIADLPFDECFSLCTWIKRMGECAIPGAGRPMVKSCGHGFSVRFAGIRGDDELEPTVHPAVIEVVPKRSSVEGLPTEGWYVCDENGVEL